MALSATSMVSRIKVHQAKLPPSNGSVKEASAQADAMLLALCQGIIDEIVQHSELVGSTTGSVK
ncbi:MAG: hypothetical protein HY849_00230 [Nitrosomonadales bacterium]|nr:hypothetical protein [Nitrosomonadales bacterium]